jgi:hypothetical protein
MSLVDPYLQTEQISNWDNYADIYILRPNSTVPAALREASVDAERASASSQGCKEACLAFESCFSWRHEGKSCAIDTGVRLGRAVVSKGNLTITSGWILERVNKTLVSHECWGFREWD